MKFTDHYKLAAIEGFPDKRAVNYVHSPLMQVHNLLLLGLTDAFCSQSTDNAVQSGAVWLFDLATNDYNVETTI